MSKGEKSVLLMDKYSTHMTDNVKNHANYLNIHIIYIPEGMTFKFQPLDVGINGIIKEKSIEKFSNFKAENPDKKYTHEQCLDDILEIKKSITKKTIINSFNCIKGD